MGTLIKKRIKIQITIHIKYFVKYVEKTNISKKVENFK